MAKRVDLHERVSEICLALPEVNERLSHGAPTYFIRDKKTFVSMHHHGHHDIDYPFLTCAAPPGAQAELIESEPDRFFRPAYVGHRGWVGLRLDIDPDWDEVAELCREAYRCVAPATLVKQLDASES